MNRHSRMSLVITTILLILFLLSYQIKATAQTCDEHVNEEQEVECCDDTYEQPDDNCQPPGPDGEACTEGSGECCGTPHGTANMSTVPSCCTPQECPPHYVWDEDECQCEFASPIIVDTTGKGFHLTSAENGVVFDIAGDGHPDQIAWTAADSGNAFLALDRNGNGRIDSGKELFGNFSPQRKSGHPNGFLALAEFDRPENGGNGDGIIDKRDAVFSHLLLWIDENHDGISQPNELHTLPELGVFSLALRYRDSRRSDEFGNWFRYRAAVNPDPRDGESKDGRWTYDVFFATIGGRTKEFSVDDQLDFAGSKRATSYSRTTAPPCKRRNSGGSQ